MLFACRNPLRGVFDCQRGILISTMSRTMICNESGAWDVQLRMYWKWLVLVIALMAGACAPSTGADLPGRGEECDADPGSATDLSSERRTG